MPIDFNHMELRPKAEGFCVLCGIRWIQKHDPEYALLVHKRYGLWEICGDQALHKGQRKASFKVCNDCLTLIWLASRDITAFHVQWLKIEMEEHPNTPRMSTIGRSVLVAIGDDKPKPVVKSWNFNDRGNILTPYCCFPLMTKVRVEILHVFDAVTDDGELIEGQVEIGLEMKLYNEEGEEIGKQQHAFEFCPCCGEKIPKIFKEFVA